MQNSDWNAFIDTLDAEPRRILTTAAEHFSDIAARFGSRILEKQEQIDGKLDQVLAEVRAVSAQHERQQAAIDGLQATVGEHDQLINSLAQRLSRLELREQASREP